MSKIFNFITGYGFPIFVSILIYLTYLRDIPTTLKFIWYFGLLVNGYGLWWYILGKDYHINKIRV